MSSDNEIQNGDVEERIGFYFMSDDVRPSEWCPDDEDNSEEFIELVHSGVFPHDDLSVETLPLGDPGPWTTAGVTLIENATAYNRHKAVVRMPVSDFKKIQTHIGTELRNPDDTPEEWWESYEEFRVESIVNVLNGEEEPEEIFGGIPRPYIELGSDLSLKKVQEGRHRTLAAERAGLDNIPVSIVYDISKPGCGGSNITQ